MHFSGLSAAGIAAALFSGYAAAQSSSDAPPSATPTPREGDVMIHVVQVGDAEGMKKFYPEKITAQPGELIQFQFYPSEHSIAQSSFGLPCEPIENTNSSSGSGFWSGFMPVTQESREMPVFTVMVNDTNPIWFYCATAKHCQGGMVGVINEPESGNTLDAYKDAAALVEKTGVPVVDAVGGTNITSPISAGDIDAQIPSNSSDGTVVNRPSGGGAATPPAPPSPPAEAGASSVRVLGAVSVLVAVAFGFLAL